MEAKKFDKPINPYWVSIVKNFRLENQQDYLYDLQSMLETDDLYMLYSSNSKTVYAKGCKIHIKPIGNNLDNAICWIEIYKTGESDPQLKAFETKCGHICSYFDTFSKTAILPSQPNIGRTLKVHIGQPDVTYLMNIEFACHFKP